MKNNTSTTNLPHPNHNTGNHTDSRIAIIGLGYVGLPLARLFATKYPVVGFDINEARVKALNAGHDSTLEVEDHILQAVLVKENPFKQQDHSPTEPVEAPTTDHSAPTTDHNNTGLFCSNQLEDIKDANIYIITVPTPVDKNHRPDLTPLIKASEAVGKVLNKGDIVIYESTVYPGATEEDCIPVLERISGLKFNVDFYAGYSPERINPGDKEHTVEKILKVTSGSTPEIGQQVDELYKSVIIAGTHLAPSIKVAEAAKVIENAQRDINIAFVNELAKIFNILEIDTAAVLEAAATKWNFLPFKPGLVGGHCIGVDPYYIAQKAQEVGYHPEIILAGRRLNDSMGGYVASQVVKSMIKKDIHVNTAKVLMLGITFKENTPDIRNSRAIDVYKGLVDYGMRVTIYDPWADPDEVEHEYGVRSIQKLTTDHSALTTDQATDHSALTTDQATDHSAPTTDQATDHSAPTTNQVTEPAEAYDAIVLTVAHKEFLEMDINALKSDNAIIYDVKGVLKDSDYCL